MTNTTVKSDRKLILTWNKSVDGLKEFLALIDAMRKIQVINEYLDSHILINREITHNTYYDVEICENNITYVYLNMQ